MNLIRAESSAMNALEMQNLADGARRLSRRLSELSQASVAARWLTDLEYMVWQDLTGQRFVEHLLVSSGGDVFPPLDDMEKEEFRQLSKAIDGWVMYDPEDAQDHASFVPLVDWESRFEAWLEGARISIA